MFGRIKQWWIDDCNSSNRRYEMERRCEWNLRGIREHLARKEADKRRRPWHYWGIRVRGSQVTYELPYEESEGVPKYGRWLGPGVWRNALLWVIELPPPHVTDRDYDDLVWFMETPQPLPTRKENTRRVRKRSVPAAAVLALVELFLLGPRVGGVVGALVLALGWVVGGVIARRQCRDQPEPRLALVYRRDVEDLVIGDRRTQ